MRLEKFSTPNSLFLHTHQKLVCSNPSYSSVRFYKDLTSATRQVLVPSAQVRVLRHYIFTILLGYLMWATMLRQVELAEMMSSLICRVDNIN